MKILVTGGTGFIGSALVPRLVAAGHVPRLLLRRELTPPAPAPVETVLGDVADPGSLTAAAFGADAIIHLAAATSGGRLAPAAAFRVNLGAASALVAAARTHGTRLLVASTQHAYLAHPGLYGRSKRMADRVLLDSGLPVTILRPSLVYGPGTRGVFVKLAGLARRLPVMPVIGAGAWRMRPLFLDDLLSIILQLLERPPDAARIYDVGGPDLVTYDEFLSAICRSAGVAYRPLHLPVWLSFAIAGVLERVLPAPPLTTDNVRGALVDAHCDSRALERECRLASTPLAEGLRRTWRAPAHA